MQTAPCFDAQDLAFEAAVRLHAPCPQHELLRYFLYPQKYWEGFLERFGRPGATPEEQASKEGLEYVYAKWFLALREACMDPEKEIVVTHGSPDSDYRLLRSTEEQS